MTRVPSCLSALLALAGACALLPSGAAAAAPAPVVPTFPTAPAETVTCSEVITYVSRGSSENDIGTTRDYAGGVGVVMLPIVTRLRSLYGDDASGRPRMQIVVNRAPSGGGKPGGIDPLGPGADKGFVGYPALGGEFALGDSIPSITAKYEDSVLDGATSIRRDLTLIHTRCPGSKLVVIGYSAGAEASRRALEELVRTSWAPAPGTGYAFVFGDSSWSGGEPNVSFVGNTDYHWKGAIRYLDQSNFLGLGEGIKPIPSYPAAWNTTSWCHGGDLACQYPAGTLDAHVSYGKQDAAGAAARIARTVGSASGQFPVPVATGVIGTTASCYRSNSTLTATFSIAGSPAGTTVKFTGDWGLGFPPFNPVTLTTAAPTKTVSFNTGLFRGQLRLKTSTGTLLDYRNACP